MKMLNKKEQSQVKKEGGSREEMWTLARKCLPEDASEVDVSLCFERLSIHKDYQLVANYMFQIANIYGCNKALVDQMGMPPTRKRRHDGSSDRGRRVKKSKKKRTPSPPEPAGPPIPPHLRGTVLREPTAIHATKDHFGLNPRGKNFIIYLLASNHLQQMRS